MKQREFIHAYNDKYRPKFNQELFKRSDDDLVEAIKAVIYSVKERCLGRRRDLVSQNN